MRILLLCLMLGAVSACAPSKPIQPPNDSAKCYAIAESAEHDDGADLFQKCMERGKRTGFWYGIADAVISTLIDGVLSGDK